MTEEKGLDPAVADKIGEYVKHKGMRIFKKIRLYVWLTLALGGPELLAVLKADATLTANPSAKIGLDEMELLFKYLDAYSVIDKVRISTSFVILTDP